MFREKEAKQDEANQTLAQKYNSVCTDYQKLKAKICQMELNEKQYDGEITGLRE